MDHHTRLQCRLIKMAHFEHYGPREVVEPLLMSSKDIEVNTLNSCYLLLIFKYHIIGIRAKFLKVSSTDVHHPVPCSKFNDIFQFLERI